LTATARVPPSSPLVGPAYRLLMGAFAPRLAARGDDASRALFRALWTTALGRIPREERAWVARIEARRAELASAEASPFVRWMSIAPVWGRFLMRTVRELSPRSCLELGTGFGISAAYQAAALELNGAGTLTTIERNEGLGGIAEEGFSRLGLKSRVEFRLRPLPDSLGSVLEPMGPIDYAFLDADHTEDATLAHFATLLPHLREGAIVVLDDINWSDGMRGAWKSIAANERVSTRLQLRRVGILVIAGDGNRAGEMRA
jgi:predicted O-methyltransferase YrrM